MICWSMFQALLTPSHPTTHFQKRISRTRSIETILEFFSLRGMRKHKIKECFSHLLPWHGENRLSQYSLVFLTQEGQRVTVNQDKLRPLRSSSVPLMVPTFLCLSGSRNICKGASGWTSVGRVPTPVCTKPWVAPSAPHKQGVPPNMRREGLKIRNSRSFSTS